eukprot:m.198635 g.198635  ORF g.198635 m.198635 type:complete len:942 (+) comp20492_c0_seq1:216-3041(+)
MPKNHLPLRVAKNEGEEWIDTRGRSASPFQRTFSETLRIASADAKRSQLQIHRQIVTDWLNTIVPSDPPIDPDTVMDRLHNGEILCQMAQTVFPTSKPIRVHRAHPDVSLRSLVDESILTDQGTPVKTSLFRPQANVEQFLMRCDEAGVTDSTKFEARDLVEGRNEYRVLNHIISVMLHQSHAPIPSSLRRCPEVERLARARTAPKNGKVLSVDDTDAIARALHHHGLPPVQPTAKGEYDLGAGPVFVRLLSPARDTTSQTDGNDGTDTDMVAREVRVRVSATVWVTLDQYVTDVLHANASPKGSPRHSSIPEDSELDDSADASLGMYDSASSRPVSVFSSSDVGDDSYDIVHTGGGGDNATVAESSLSRSHTDSSWHDGAHEPLDMRAPAGNGHDTPTTDSNAHDDPLALTTVHDAHRTTANALEPPVLYDNADAAVLNPDGTLVATELTMPPMDIVEDDTHIVMEVAAPDESMVVTVTPLSPGDSVRDAESTPRGRWRDAESPTAGSRTESESAPHESESAGGPAAAGSDEDVDMAGANSDLVDNTASTEPSASFVPPSIQIVDHTLKKSTKIRTELHAYAAMMNAHAEEATVMDTDGHDGHDRMDEHDDDGWDEVVGLEETNRLATSVPENDHDRALDSKGIAALLSGGDQDGRNVLESDTLHDDVTRALAEADAYQDGDNDTSSRPRQRSVTFSFESDEKKDDGTHHHTHSGAEAIVGAHHERPASTLEVMGRNESSERARLSDHDASLWGDAYKIHAVLEALDMTIDNIPVPPPSTAISSTPRRRQQRMRPTQPDIACADTQLNTTADELMANLKDRVEKLKSACNLADPPSWQGTMSPTPAVMPQSRGKTRTRRVRVVRTVTVTHRNITASEFALPPRDPTPWTTTFPAPHVKACSRTVYRHLRPAVSAYTMPPPPRRPPPSSAFASTPSASWGY